MVQRGSDGQWVSFSCALSKFSHFDENNKERAVFRNDFVPRNPDETPFRGLCRKLGYQEDSRSVLGSQSGHPNEEKPGIWPEFEVDMPRRHEQIFIIQVRAGLNDTRMPASRINIDNQEFSFEWKGMFTSFFGQQLAAAKVGVLVGQIIVGLGEDRAWIDAPQDPQLSSQTEYMARPSEPERKSELRRETERQNLSLDLVAQVTDWKDIVSEIDWLDSSPAERLIRKHVVDRTLHLNDDGILEVENFQRHGMYSMSQDGYIRWGLIQQQQKDRNRRRVDRVKRGLVIPRSLTVEEEPAKECFP